MNRASATIRLEILGTGCPLARSLRARGLPYHLPRGIHKRSGLVWGLRVVGARLVYPGDPSMSPWSKSFRRTKGSSSGPRRMQPGTPPPPSPKDRVRLEIASVGCDPRNCSRSCDKAHAGVDYNRTLARLAVPHFGQSSAGSALNAIALCLLSFMASHNPAPGERRGASVRTVNGVVWVDDFQFWTVALAHTLCN